MPREGAPRDRPREGAARDGARERPSGGAAEGGAESLDAAPASVGSLLSCLHALLVGAQRAQAAIEMGRWRQPGVAPHRPGADGSRLDAIPASSSAYLDKGSVPPPRTCGVRFNASGVLACFYHSPSPYAGLNEAETPRTYAAFSRRAPNTRRAPSEHSPSTPVPPGVPFSAFGCRFGVTLGTALECLRVPSSSACCSTLEPFSTPSPFPLSAQVCRLSGARARLAARPHRRAAARDAGDCDVHLIASRLPRDRLPTASRLPPIAS